MIVFVMPLASLVTVFMYICMFFVFGYVLSKRLPRVYASYRLQHALHAPVNALLLSSKGKF